ncbi:hypothetical protein [Pseudomonas sp. BMS12]|uniref:hypothetical protein n=1 Tax=Pseudomonas sp. BMS12 TaxID=1796033 RepID=UPI00083B7596|nr:hypothetical protein [Pseudomonas sp. BMS12]
MSRKKAQAASLKFKFEHDDALTPAINIAFQEIVQWAQLYRTGDAISRENCRKRLMEVSEAWLAWKFEEAQNTHNGFAGAEQRREERKPEWDRWQMLADAQWAANPRLSIRDVAGRIAGPGEKAETIRRHISKPSNN